MHFLTKACQRTTDQQRYAQRGRRLLCEDCCRAPGGSMPSIKLFELAPTRSARVRWMLLEAELPYDSAGNSVEVFRSAETAQHSSARQAACGDHRRKAIVRIRGDRDGDRRPRPGERTDRQTGD